VFHLTRWCFVIGVSCGIATIIFGIAHSLEDFGLFLPLLARTFIEGVTPVLAVTFMGLGFVLLIEAIYWVGRNWSELSSFGKFLAVFGLFLTHFLGGYIVHYFFARREAQKPTSAAA